MLLGTALGIAAAEAVKGMPIWSILVFPALFTAGMTLIDTTDGVLMLGAYGWAFAEPQRTLAYNLTMTGLSVAMALVIGAIEVLGLTAEQLGLTGGIRDVVGLATENLGLVGGFIIAAFAATWLVSLAIGRWRGGLGYAASACICWRRRARPGRSPVGPPSVQTGRPLTKTWAMPAAGMVGLSNVARSITVTGSKTVRSA